MAKPTKLVVFVSAGALGGAVLLWLLGYYVSPVHYAQNNRVPTTPPADHVATSSPSIFFTGDTMLARHVEVLLSKSLVTPYDFERLFKDATLVFTNFESAMANPHIPTPSRVMQFSTKAENIPLLNDLKVTHASLANNHSRDYGQASYDYAKETLLKNDIIPFGDAVTVSSSSLVYRTVGDTKFAVIGLHTLFVPPDPVILAALIKEAKTNSDLQLVYIHWGDEYETIHNQSQEELATWLEAQGIDAVIGHHPHVVQDVDFIKNMPVFYSLGNFIFDQYFSEAVKTGLVLELEVSDTELVFRLHPQYQCALATPCLMPAAEEQAFLEALAARSHPSLKDQIMAKNITIQR